MKLMLLVIDMQKCFLEEIGDKKAVAECCEVINYVASMLRSGGHPVIHVKDVESRGEIPEDQLAFTDGIEVTASDRTLEKIHSNAFWETDLDDIVGKAGVDLIIVSGQAAEHCVVFTYNGAIERGHTAAVLQGGILSARPGRVSAMMEDRPVIGHSAIKAIVAAG